MNMARMELLEEINSKKEEVISLVNAGKLDEAKEAKAGLQALQDRFDLLEGLEPEAGDIGGHAKEVTDMENRNDAIKAFAAAVRSRFMNTANETTGADGGYTVPVDIQTQINEYREARPSLVDLISVEAVSTNSGARTYRTKAEHSGFLSVDEAAAIGEQATPQFERIEYSITKYAGYMPVTNELLEDSDANITNEMVRWLGEEGIATDNAHIIDVLKGFSETPGTVTDIDGIKEIVNVTLGSAYAGYVSIITNDSGLNWLDTLKDSTGRELLRAVPDTTSPFKMQVAIGAHVIPVVAVPNSTLANDSDTLIPMFIGSFADGVKKFDRNQLTVSTSNVATVGSLNAFEQDLTLFRGIMRAAYVQVDPDAVVYVDIDTSASTGE